MLTNMNVWAFASFWLVLAAAAWVALVPDAISSATFAWANSAVVVVTALAVILARTARPTRSIAHVLYDVEHPSEQRR